MPNSDSISALDLSESSNNNALVRVILRLLCVPFLIIEVSSDFSASDKVTFFAMRAMRIKWFILKINN